MFNVLLESRARRARQRGGATLSVVVHTAVVLLAVVGTRRPALPAAPRVAEQVTPIYAPAPEPVVRTAPVTQSAAPSITHRTFSGAPVFTYFDSIPTSIDPMLDAAVLRENPIEWGPGVAATSRFGSRAATGGLGPDGIPFAEGVDKPALALAGNPVPQYPEVLQRAGIQGGVTIQVVVDTTGRAEMGTLKVLSSDHLLFESAVIGVLPRLRFIPAVAADRKVKMWVIMPFVFEVRR